MPSTDGTVVTVGDPIGDLSPPAAGPRLSRRDLTQLVIFMIAAQNIILAVAGSSVLSLLLLTAMEGGCYAVIYKYGSSDINAGIVLAIGLSHLIIASFIKIALLQSLDANLIVPATTELVTLVYFACLVLAFLVSRKLPVARTRVYADPNLRTLEWLIIMSSILMLLPLFSNPVDDANVESPANFLAVVSRGFPLVAMVCAVIHALKRSNGRTIIDAWSVTVLGAAIFIGLASNSREGVLAPPLIALITPLYRGYRFNYRAILVMGLFGLFVSFIISPAILIVRSDRGFLGFSERIENTIETAGLLMIGDPATTEKAETPLDFINYSVWGRYFGRPIPFSDRIGLIQTTDALAASITGGNYVTLGGSTSDMIAGLFPNFVLDWFDISLERGKATTDYVAGSLGLADMAALTYLTIPVDAEAYATGGMWAVVYKTFLAYLLIFYVNRLVIGNRPITAVLPIALLFLGYHVCSESDAGGILYYALRVVPQFAVTFYFLYWIARLLGSTPVRSET
jgi:hypothetical protein